MNPYSLYIEPMLVDLACSAGPIQHQRRKVAPRAKGRILEVGAGSGHNFPHYDPDAVDMVFALEPSDAMRKRARKRLAAAPFEIKWLDLPGEEIPLDDRSVDTVLITYTMCTIPDVASALEQMRRVLKPDGELIFCEHGAAPDPNVRKWQERINPVWKKIAGGCNLQREIPDLLTGAGFALSELDQMYLPKTPKFAGFNYWGVARHA